jgi:hypothetical protein
VTSDDAVTAKGIVNRIIRQDGLELAECDVWLERDGERLLTGTATIQLDGK